MKTNKVGGMLFYVAAILFYLAAIINFTSADRALAVIWLSFGWHLARHFFALVQGMQRKQKRAKMARKRNKYFIRKLTAEKAIIHAQRRIRPMVRSQFL